MAYAHDTKTVHNYKGFEVKAAENPTEFTISLEGRHVAKVGSVRTGEECIDFYHAASEASFSIGRARAETARADAASNAGPEPVLTTGGRVPSTPWVKWYRTVSGCGLKEAFQEGVSRIQREQSEAKR